MERTEMEDENNIYIHYGSTYFDKNLFTEIKNLPLFTKPAGGFWASNVKSKYGWKRWTEDEGYYTSKYREDNCFKFKLKDGARILRLKKPSDLIELPKNQIADNISFCTCLNFEELQKSYDAIEVIIDKLYWDLYGWDCDSILIMNKDIVVVEV